MAGSRPLPLPDDTDLPLFVYGLLKPGELAYKQVEPFVDGRPEDAEVAGTLYVRDGLPLLKPEGGLVRGSLLTFKAEAALPAYETVAGFEPRAQYQWKRMSLLSPTGRTANVLVGKKPEVASVYHESWEWTGAEDPILNEGVELVRQIANEYGETEFDVTPHEYFDWERLFRLQMAYLFLWTIVERYVALAHGPGLDPGQKIEALARDAIFAAAVSEIAREHRVADSRDPTDTYSLDRAEPLQSAKYYYQVRNNLIHRGKGTWRDGEIVRQSLTEVLRIVERLLSRSRDC